MNKRALIALGDLACQSDLGTAKEYTRFIEEVGEEDDSLVQVNVFGEVGVKVGALIELGGLKKTEGEWLPYYDMAALRSAFGNPDYKWRTDFRFTNGCQVEIRNGVPYLNKGSVSNVGDTLLGVQGTLGEIFHTGEKCYATESVKRIVYKYDLLIPEYFELFIENKREEINKANTSQMIPSLNRIAFNNMLIPLRTKEQQKEVLNRLSLTKFNQYIQARINALQVEYELERDYIFSLLKEA